MGTTKQFRGSYNLKIDDRGRIKIPSRYLSILESQYGHDVYCTSLNGDNVLVYPLPVWEKIEGIIATISVRNQTLEEYIRLTSFWGNETEIDQKGRILIQPELREKSVLKDDVLVLGQIDHLVIWRKEMFVSRYIPTSFTDEKLNEVSRLVSKFSSQTDIDQGSQPVVKQ